MKEQTRISGRILLICVFAAFCIMPVWAGDVTITREIDPSSVPVGEEVQVQISIDGLSTGGIVETVPDGFIFLSTTYPPEKYRISENTILFSVIDDSKITYWVKAEKEGTWTFTGIWDDTINKTGGTIPENQAGVGVGVPKTASAANRATDENSSTQSSGPGMILHTGIILVALIVAGAYYRSPERR